MQIMSTDSLILERVTPTILISRGQGNRISKHLQKFGEEGIVPSGAFEFSAQGAF